MAALRDRLDAMFASIDAKDTERFLGFLTAGASFRFGSMPAAEGRDAIREAVDGFFSSIAGCRHAVMRVVEDGGCVVCEGEVTYTRHDGTTVTLPFADIFEFDDDLIASYKIYLDAGPLYAA